MKFLLVLLLIGDLQYNRICCSKPAFNDTQLSSLQPVISRYCPKVTSLTCDGETEGIIASHCCSGCSCKRSCGLTGNCCYQEGNLDKLDEERIRCMFPNTKNLEDIVTADLPMYKFVVGPPVGGCVAEGSCNSSEPLIPWKSFYPVYSRSTNLNYISEECASCHGVIDGIKWISIVSFLVEPSLNGLFENLSRDKSPRKYLLFAHPGNESENMQGICSSNLMNLCSVISDSSYLNYVVAKNFANLNISTEDFANGCLYGPYMPIFYDEKVGIETNSSCRPVLCPTMQLRTDQGACTFPSKSWLIPSLSVTLNLTTYNSVDILLSSLSDSRLLAAFYGQSPWNRCWRIEKVGVRSYMQHVHDRNVTEFVLLMKCNLYEKNPTLMTESIQQSLSQNWLIKTDTGIISLYQDILAIGPPQLARHRTLNKTIFLPLWYDRYKRDVRFRSIVSIPHWEVLISKGSNARSFSLNKLFFCSQVSLKADEYDILFTPFLIIRYISSQRLFFESEIVVRRISDEKREIQICLEDSDLEIISSKVAAQHGFEKAYLLWFVLIKLIMCI